MKNVFNSIGMRLMQKARVKHPSAQRALVKIMGRRHFSQMMLGVPDRRAAFKAAAQYMRRSEHDLLLQISRQIDIPFLSRLLPIAAEQLPQGLQLSELKRLGCIPVMSGHLINGLACVEPYLVSELMRGLSAVTATDIQLYLASWDNVSEALEQSAERSKDSAQFASQSCNESTQVPQNTLEEIIALIVRQAQKHGSRQVKLFKHQSQTLYSFDAADGRRATGTLDPSVCEALLSYLEENNGFEINLRQHQGSTEISPVIVRREDRVFLISVTAAEEKILEAVPLAQKDTTCSDLAVSAALAEKDHQVVGNVLIVDDNKIFVKVLSRFMQRHGLKSQNTLDAQSALDKLETGKLVPDLIVCDVHMPGTNGYAFLKKLRASSSCAHLPVIMLTSDDDVETEIRFLTAGADAYLTKNADPRLLCVHIKRLIDRAKHKKAA